MNREVSPVTIHILDKEYVIACPEEERDGLFASAGYLNKKMKEIRDTGKVVGADRVAVMAALNIAHELLQARNENESYNDSLSKRIKSLQNKIDSALQDSRQIEL